MNEERTLVLEMLAAGKIDVAQADELLGSLEPPPSVSLYPSLSATPAAKTSPLKLSPEQVLELKDHDIDARFVRKLQDFNLRALSFEEILELGVHEVPPKFIREMRESFPEIAVKQIIELHNHDIDTDFLRELREANLLSADPDAIIQLKEERDQEDDA